MDGGLGLFPLSSLPPRLGPAVFSDLVSSLNYPCLHEGWRLYVCPFRQMRIQSVGAPDLLYYAPHFKL